MLRGVLNIEAPLVQLLSTFSILRLSLGWEARIDTEGSAKPWGLVSVQMLPFWGIDSSRVKKANSEGIQGSLPPTACV